MSENLILKERVKVLFHVGECLGSGFGENCANLIDC
jgi:hypothetical protein